MLTSKNVTKDEFGTKYPRLRRTASAANFRLAGRRGYTTVNNNEDDSGKLCNFMMHTCY